MITQQSLLNQIKQHIPGCYSLVLINHQSGEVLLKADGTPADVDLQAAYQAQIVKDMLTFMVADPNFLLKDDYMVLDTDEDVYYFALTENQKFAMIATIEKAKANVAFTRMVVDKAKKEVFSFFESL